MGGIALLNYAFKVDWLVYLVFVVPITTMAFPRLADAICATIGTKTYVGDPWARVVYPLDLRPVLDQIGARFSVAVGLAMRDIE